MTTLLALSEVAVSLSVLWVWIWRHQSVIEEFRRFELADQTLAQVGAIKVTLALSLLLSIWITAIAPLAASGMALMMVAAQYFHEKHQSPLMKRLPSAALLILSIWITYETV